MPTSNPTMEPVWIVGDLTCDAACTCQWAPVDELGTADAMSVYDP